MDTARSSEPAAPEHPGQLERAREWRITLVRPSRTAQPNSSWWAGSATSVAVGRSALIPKGRWPSHEPAGVNVNVLTTARRTDMGESTAIHGTLVRIELVG